MNELDIFSAAVELRTPEDRDQYLDQACGDNPALRQRIVSLLRSSNEAGSFIESPAEGFGTSITIDRPIAEGPGTVIGPYKLLQQIGEGGMGVVFMAEQTGPIQRTVALKIIKPGMDTRQVIARFEAERQALAMMDHPNIAKVFDAGTTETGRPYFVMELVKGVPITKYCGEKQLSLRDRLQLFMPVCHAVQHAHQKGVIHRDLKPSNVLIAEYDDRAVAKVIDFGVAKAMAQKLTDGTMFTEFGQVIGTVEYMSPEQAKFNQLDIDTRSDIYSLGVLLYELLTGSTPFEQKRLREAAFDELLRIIREEEPPKPSTRLSTSETLPSIAANRHSDSGHLSKEVQGELDWIVMKALEKDRNRRYETANGLLRDIERYLHDEPVQACPPSTAYRFRKFARRNKSVLAIVSAGVMILLIVIAGLIASNRLISAQRSEAEAQRQRAEKNFLKSRVAIRELMTEPATGAAEWSQLTPALRKAFSERAANYYHSLVQEDESDPSLQYESAVGYRSLAYLHEKAREYAQAEKFSTQSIAILERLSRASPDVVEYRHQLGYSVWELAGILALTNRPDASEAAFRRSIALYEQLCAERPDVPDYPVMLIKISCYFGDELLRQNRIQEAEQAFRRSLEVHSKWVDRLPEEVTEIHTTCMRMATVFAATRSPQEAADAYDSIVQLYSENHDVWFFAAALELRAGDLDQYRSVCRTMIERFGNSNVPHIAERTAKTCSLAPDAVDDPLRVVTLADRALKGTEQHGYRWFYEMAKAMAEYRAGHADAAVEWVTRVNPRIERGLPWDATMFSVLAMAQYRLGKHEEADDALDKAEQILTDKMPDMNRSQILRANNWHDWLHAQFLYREAEELLTSKNRATTE
jgi:serine/threonine protein kinase